ncbi:MAG: phenylalanine--tRNA ligase subunit beta [Fidelibacterota bacterium]
MIVSIDWLKDFVDIEAPARELADLLTNASIETIPVPGERALDVETMPNRPDCMSHVGIAREIALITGKKLRLPKVTLKESERRTAEEVRVDILDPERCPRYACRVVRNVTVGPSPSWMVERLKMAGIRSLNNVVDISNYVLMELGHPLHVFDLDTVRKNTILVRMGKRGDTLTTLDGEERKIGPENLLICDAERPVALAGVMGGENSEVTETTKHVLIESAYFDPVTIRKGSRSLGLSTEASKRFERGTDYVGLLRALDRVAHMIWQLAGGEVLKGVVDEYPLKMKRKSITLNSGNADAVAGVHFNHRFIQKTFRGLEISFTRSGASYRCLMPTFRPDLTRSIDLVEELTRVYGYENIESDTAFEGLLGKDTGDRMEEISRLKAFFAGLGFNECVSNSLINREQSGHCFPGEGVGVRNPLSLEMSVLRTSLLPGLFSAVSHNLKRDEQDLALFEYGNIFLPHKESVTGCKEKEQFSGVICGHRRPRRWKGGPEENDFYVLKGYMQALAAFLRLERVQFSDLSRKPGFLFGQALRHREGRTLAEFGEFRPNVLDAYDISIPVFGFILNLETVRKIMRKDRVHTAPSQYPGISRDLSFVVKKNTPVGDIQAVMNAWGTGLLKRVTLYDMYEGKTIPRGHKSVTFNLFFQDRKRTLKDEEVDEIVSTIISKVSEGLNAALRKASQEEE